MLVIRVCTHAGLLMSRLRQRDPLLFVSDSVFGLLLQANQSKNVSRSHEALVWCLVVWALVWALI